MELRERFAELRELEAQLVPAYRGGTPRRQPAGGRTRLGLAFALVMIVCGVFVFKPRAAFTPEDRAAAQAIAAWHPPTDVLLRMPSTGVSR